MSSNGMMGKANKMILTAICGKIMMMIRRETGINLENLIKINRKNSRNRLIIALFSLEEVIINRKINNNNKVFKGGLIVSL